MAAKPRNQIVAEGEIGVYHCWSRCVQRAFLCGQDPATGHDYDFRRDQILALIKHQVEVFAVDLGAVSVLSNHMHQVVRTRPDLADAWDDEEVALRWRLAWPSWRNGQWIREVTDEQVGELLADPCRLERARKGLASLSWFMARIKEPAARLFNAQSGASGHVFDQRFGCRRLTTDLEVLGGLAYADVNQVRAAMAGSLEESRCSSIADRLRAWRQREAQAAVEQFGRGPEDHCQLTRPQAEQLLADCYLAPITDQGPPLLVAERKPARAQADVSEPAPDESAEQTEPDSEPEPPARPRRPAAQPTYEIYHRRFLQRRAARRRASDHAILAMPFGQYERLVRQAGEKADRPLHPAADSPGNLTPPPPASYRRAADAFVGWLLKTLGNQIPSAILSSATPPRAKPPP